MDIKEIPVLSHSDLARLKLKGEPLTCRACLYYGRKPPYWRACRLHNTLVCESETSEASTKETVEPCSHLAIPVFGCATATLTIPDSRSWYYLKPVFGKRAGKYQQDFMNKQKVSFKVFEERINSDDPDYDERLDGSKA